MSNATSHNNSLKIDSAALRHAGPYQDITKRILDVVLSLLMLPIIIPVIAVLYVMVRLDGGPGFYGHSRVGRNGRTFQCWKVRTMVQDSQERLEHLLATDPEAREEWKKDRKLRNDPRVTRFGAFMRSSSLDELPQIWNVLKGEMSLIGPRPITSSELHYYGGHQWVYLSMRPGVTGLWQVSGRNDVSYDERVQLDADYYEAMTLRSDMRILWRTASVVLARSGY
ncbi:sugar transferase [Alloyangia pacifica]|uniref:sugar transferase n=1 Tax=Alloyangia pacifica TaxID=311180 RepID=UPI001CD3E31F|nr:sugar transferase [Alloyangia pacifica]MCA0994797.1 sugar transferase [Alloyangia pacifica]